MRTPLPFGRHLLLERVAVGGMAEVYRAKSFGVEGFERFVAVKRILGSMAEDAEFIRMFIDEARIASYLTHQNIVQIYELGRHEGAYYISMEYVGGRDLRTILDRFKKQRRSMDPAMACFITSRISEALDYAHRKRDPAGRDYKIIHRDVSPQNVIISYEGEVKLCDFGIAKAVTQSTRTQVGVLKGKFAYMSPEQVRGRPIDRRSDLFALGVIFYEMLTGERLFLGESDYATLEAVRATRVPPPQDVNPSLPDRLAQIVVKMLAREPDQRYQWASEVIEDLHSYLYSAGQIYHAHHLRQFIQETYAQDIAAENAKLETFMELKLEEEPRYADMAALSAAPVRAILNDEPSEPQPGDKEKTAAVESFPVAKSETDGPIPRLVAPRLASSEDDDALITVINTENGSISFGDGATFNEDGQGATLASVEDPVPPPTVAATPDLALATIADDSSGDSDHPLGAEIAETKAAISEQLRAAGGENGAPAKAALAAPGAEATPAPWAHDPASAREVPDDPTREWVAPGPTTERSRVNPSPAPRMIRERLRAGDPTEPPPPAVVPPTAERASQPPPPVKRDTAPPPAGAHAAKRETPPAVGPPQVSTVPSRALFWLPALVFISALLLVLVLLMTQQPHASLHLETVPVSTVEVYLDGKLAAMATPVELPELEVGNHRLEIRAPGFRPYTQSFVISERRPHTLTVPMERDRPPGQVEVTP